MVTNLKDDDECQPGSQDVPELQGKLVGYRAPGWCSVISVPAVSGHTAVIHLPHIKHRQAAVHIALQAPGRTRKTCHTVAQAILTDKLKSQAFYTLVLVVLALVHAGAVFEGINKAGDVVRGDSNDKGVGNDSQNTNPLQNAMPDTCNTKKKHTMSIKH